MQDEQERKGAVAELEPVHGDIRKRAIRKLQLQSILRGSTGARTHHAVMQLRCSGWGSPWRGRVMHGEHLHIMATYVAGYEDTCHETSAKSVSGM
jgi:hypothetical protein